eukprot:CAMPEP_0196779696 /NCGR_PEP_ID=MMETSP1104-20130614/6538_1 /TAXON_ID=33652 /ORGANISM="Cafeteria sp., Strain Caron Lab Isolate" /LENGTH=123 /DNA_ID=CAMNT_0042149879 /DNA_START=1 /DNA_END=369 /DNA_ORIENTATION=+
MFRPSTAEHAMPLSAGDLRAMGGSPQRMPRAPTGRSPHHHPAPTPPSHRHGHGHDHRAASALEHREYAAAQTPPRPRSTMAEAPPWGGTTSWGEPETGGGELLGSSRFERAPTPEEQVWERSP